jgi:uncharacterized protein (PEP-CTERM system associated)
MAMTQTARWVFDLALDETAGGARLNVSVGRDFDLPDGGLAFDLGVSRGASGSFNLTGGLSYNHEFDQGSVTASLRQSITAGSDDTDRLQTSLSAGLSRPLSPLASLDLGLAYVISENLGSGVTTDTANLSATLGYALSSDWDLSLGYRYESRDQDGAGQAQDNVVFLGVRRNFEFPL